MNISLRPFEVTNGVWAIGYNQGLARVSDAHLLFEVSSDEEYVRLTMTVGDQTFDLGARCHNYLLLTLARRRIVDRQRSLRETACGWVYLDELARDPTMAPPHLNLNIFRLRKQFAAYRLSDPSSIVERRPQSRDLRIGTGRIDVVRL